MIPDGVQTLHQGADGGVGLDLDGYEEECASVELGPEALEVNEGWGAFTPTEREEEEEQI